MFKRDFIFSGAALVSFLITVTPAFSESHIENLSQHGAWKLIEAHDDNDSISVCIAMTVDNDGSSIAAIAEAGSEMEFLVEFEGYDASSGYKIIFSDGTTFNANQSPIMFSDSATKAGFVTKIRAGSAGSLVFYEPNSDLTLASFPLAKTRSLFSEFSKCIANLDREELPPINIKGIYPGMMVDDVVDRVASEFSIGCNIRSGRMTICINDESKNKIFKREYITILQGNDGVAEVVMFSCEMLGLCGISRYQMNSIFNSFGYVQDGYKLADEYSSGSDDVIYTHPQTDVILSFMWELYQHGESPVVLYFDGEKSRGELRQIYQTALEELELPAYRRALKNWWND